MGLQDCVCPDIRAHWKLLQVGNSDRVVLKAIACERQFQFSSLEALVLRHFTGDFTVAQTQARCEKQFQIPPTFVEDVIERLVTLGILEKPTLESQSTPTSARQSRSLALKAAVEWIQHPEGYWILRNPEDITYLQLSDRDKQVVDSLQSSPPTEVATQFELDLSYVKHLFQLLAATGMLEGTQPAKPPRGKFTPMQLLFFKFKLFNPDYWLTRTLPYLRWIWTRSCFWVVCGLLTWATIIGLSQRAKILFTWQELWQHYQTSLMLPFGLLAMLVVTLHELGHAFTLKHYGGIVPEVGLMFMFFMPAAYTNTTDSYSLIKRSQRVLVVGAGLLVQVIVAALALGLWNVTGVGTWLHTTSYLLMMSALFTIALNLNPLAKFDGYYLAVAITGINNLRSRSFNLYAHWFRGLPTGEKPRERWILAAYAPFSVGYSLLIFGFLLTRVADWLLTYIPAISLSFLLLWTIYFYAPLPAKRA
jgi:putative peptide zinc metalloprotease protein